MKYINYFILHIVNIFYVYLFEWYWSILLLIAIAQLVQVDDVLIMLNTQAYAHTLVCNLLYLH